MPKQSSPTAHVTYLDVAAAVRELTDAALRLHDADDNVIAVVLFGSLSDSTATPSSDSDLLVVLRTDTRRVMDRVPDYTAAFDNLSLPAQVFPWTEAELRDRIADGDPFALEILHTGTTLAGTIPGKAPA